MPIVQKLLFQVEFRRLDEQQVISYLIAVDSNQTEIQAIEKAESMFNSEMTGNNVVLFSMNDMKDTDKRREADPVKTYWRNRCAEAGVAFY